MDYPIQSPGQLSSHLRALRRAKGLSQAQLGQLLGVGQARIARIERDPAAVGVEQFLSVVSALGAHVVLRSIDGRSDAGSVAKVTKPAKVAKAEGQAAEEPW